MAEVGWSWLENGWGGGRRLLWCSPAWWPVWGGWPCTKQETVKIPSMRPHSPHYYATAQSEASHPPLHLHCHPWH